MAQAVATQRPMPLVAVWVVGEQNHEEILLVFCDTCIFYPYTAPMEKKGDLVFSSLKVNDGIKLDKIHFVQSKYASEPNPVTSSKNSTTHRANLKLRLLAIPTMWVPPAELEN